MVLVVYGNWRMLGHSPEMDWQFVVVAGVFPSEGGHVSFAPTTDQQIGLLRFLTKRFGQITFGQWGNRACWYMHCMQRCSAAMSTSSGLRRVDLFGIVVGTN